MTRRQTAFMGARRNRLRQWREERDLTQEQLAERIEMSHTQIGKIERGIQGLREENVWKIVKEYDCHPGELFEEMPEPNYPDYLLELAAIYSKMTAEQQRFWLASGQGIIKEEPPEPALKEAN